MRRRRQHTRRRQQRPPTAPMLGQRRPPPRLSLPLLLLLLLLAHATVSTQAVEFDPCSEVQPISKGDPFVVGLAYWPGGLQTDWGPEAYDGAEDPTAGLHPCNGTHRAALAAAGARFAAFSARADRLSALKTTFPEELFLTGANPNASAPRVISVVAFRHGVRSEPRYVASFDSQVTSGTGFVGSLSLVASFTPPGQLSRLLWWNLTCNDCGGRASARCLDGTACAVPAAACTCDGGGGGAPVAMPPGQSPAPSSSSDATAAPPPPSRRRRFLLQQQAADASAAPPPLSSPSPSPSPSPGACDYGSMSVCATAINLAFDGADAKSRAFTTAAAVRNLNSYSLLRLYSAGKDKLFAAADAWSGPVGDAWGKFRDAQGQLQAAYTEGDSGRVTGGGSIMG